MILVVVVVTVVVIVVVVIVVVVVIIIVVIVVVAIVVVAVVGIVRIKQITTIRTIIHAAATRTTTIDLFLFTAWKVCPRNHQQLLLMSWEFNTRSMQLPPHDVVLNSLLMQLEPLNQC